MLQKDIVKRIWTKKELLESFCSLSILNVLNLVLPLITLPYLIHVVGIEKYGVYSFAYTIIQYILLVSTYGFNLSATKLISARRMDCEYISGVFNAVIVCRLLLALFSFLLFLLVSLFISAFSDVVCIVLYGIGIVLGDALTPIWFFQGMGKMRYLTLVNAFSKILFTFLIFVLISAAEDYRMILFIQSLGYIVAALAGLFISKRVFNISFYLPTYKSVSFQFQDGLHIFLSTIGINLYRNSNILLLGILSSEYIVGVYSAAEKLIKGAQGIISPVTDALFPYLSKKISDNSFAQTHVKLIFKISKYLLFLYIFVVGGFYIISPLAVSWLFPLNIQKEIIQLLNIMAPVIFFGGFGYVFGILGLYSIGEKQSFLKYVIFSGCISVIVLLGFIKIFPLLSGAIAMLSSEFFLFLLSFLALKKHYRNVSY